MTRRKAKMNNRRIHIRLFNDMIKVGDEVYYFNDFGSLKKDTVTHEATKMGDHTPVMWLKEAGSYLLSRFVSKA
jgi:hypothetical protein